MRDTLGVHCLFCEAASSALRAPGAAVTICPTRRCKPILQPSWLGGTKDHRRRLVLRLILAVRLSSRDGLDRRRSDRQVAGRRHPPLRSRRGVRTSLRFLGRESCLGLRLSPRSRVGRLDHSLGLRPGRRAIRVAVSLGFPTALGTGIATVVPTSRAALGSHLLLLHHLRAPSPTAGAAAGHDVGGRMDGASRPFPRAGPIDL